MSDNSLIEWTGSTLNIVTGCTKISDGCDHCLAPETRVLRADMTWAPIEDIRNGDGTGQQVYWRVAKPEDDRVVLDRLKEYLADFGVSVEVRSFDPGQGGFPTVEPKPMAKVETRKRDHLAAIATLSSEGASREWMAGWLAGMFDTDASYTGGNLRYCQMKNNHVLDRAVRFAKELGFEIQREYWENNCPTARLVGGVPENIAFLAAISPALTRRCRDFYGRRTETIDVPVVSMRRGPVRKLIDITTSTGTFVAEGALTHNCYIERTPPFRMSGRRFDKPGIGGTTGLILHPERLALPLKWRAPRTVFVNSLADLFHGDVPTWLIAGLWATMARTPQHTYQVLSKRAGRMHRLLGKDAQQRLAEAAPDRESAHAISESPWPLPNVHVGLSVESQRWADIRIPLLADPDVQAAVKFLSVEPLIEAVDLRLGGHAEHDSEQGFDGWTRACVECSTDWGEVRWFPADERSPISWLIVGAESGPGARPCETDWIRSVVRQAQGADVPVFVKQMGTVWAKSAGAAHHKGGDPQEWPEDLRVREMPRAPEAVSS